MLFLKKCIPEGLWSGKSMQFFFVKKSVLDICSQIIHNLAKRRKILPSSFLKVDVSSTNIYSGWRPTEDENHRKDIYYRSWAPQERQLLQKLDTWPTGYTVYGTHRLLDTWPTGYTVYGTHHLLDTRSTGYIACWTRGPRDTQFMGLIACRIRGHTKDAIYGIR